VEEDGRIEQNLVKAIFDVFEKMYYLYLEPPAGDGGDLKWTASIGFSGVVSGRFEARFSEAIASAMVENSLVLDPSQVTDELREDCLKECVNMICGSFLRLVDSDRIAHLTIPSCVRTPAVQVAQEGGIRLKFEADGMRVAFRTEIE
jgi:CheY-specific phosphatase CheX